MLKRAAQRTARSMAATLQQAITVMPELVCVAACDVSRFDSGALLLLCAGVQGRH
jgi:ABC-type transporter Mla MlaB component